VFSVRHRLHERRSSAIIFAQRRHALGRPAFTPISAKSMKSTSMQKVWVPYERAPRYRTDVLPGYPTPKGSHNKAQGRRRRTLGIERRTRNQPQWGCTGAVAHFSACGPVWPGDGTRCRSRERGGPALPGCAARPWALMCDAFGVGHCRGFAESNLSLPAGQRVLLQMPLPSLCTGKTALDTSAPRNGAHVSLSAPATYTSVPMLEKLLSVSFRQPAGNSLPGFGTDDEAPFR